MSTNHSSFVCLLVIVAMSLAACSSEEESPDPTDVTLGETTFVTVVNPTINDVNEPEMPEPGDEVADVLVEAQDVSVVTNEDGVGVLAPIEAGDVELYFEGDDLEAFLTQSIADQDLVEVAVAAEEEEAQQMVRVVYAFGGDVVELDEEASFEEVEDALSDSDQIVLLSDGVYTVEEGEELEFSGSSVTLFGAGTEGGRVTIDGDVTISGSGNRIRGADITGDVDISGSDAGVSFSTIGGDVEIAGSDVILLQNRFCGQMSISGSDTVALGNEGLEPLAADCPEE